MYRLNSGEFVKQKKRGDNMPKSVRKTFIDKFIKNSYAIDTKGYNVKPISDRELLEDFNELKKEIGVKANLFIWDNEIDKWATVNKNGSIGIAEIVKCKPKLFRRAVIIHELTHLELKDFGHDKRFKDKFRENLNNFL